MVRVTPRSVLDRHCVYSRRGRREMSALVRGRCFSTPKPVDLVKLRLQLVTDPERSEIVMDFFAGSGTTGHAVMAQNATDGWQSPVYPRPTSRAARPGEQRPETRSAFATITEAAQHRRTDQGTPPPRREEDQGRESPCSRAISASASSSSTPATSARGSRTATTSTRRCSTPWST